MWGIVVEGECMYWVGGMGRFIDRFVELVGFVREFFELVMVGRYGIYINC